MARRRALKIGDIVLVPWGRADPIRGRVVDVWGDPPVRVRVELLTDYADDEPRSVLLLSPSVVKPA